MPPADRRADPRAGRALRWALVAGGILAVIATAAWGLPGWGGTGPALLWSDEFDGPAGSAPAAHWRTLEGGGGWGNGELQTYTSRTENVALDGEGHLRITARREADGTFTSARIETRTAFTHGTITARIKAPAGRGIWPAFWTLGEGHERVGWPRSGEIDIMELRNDADVVYANVHVLDRASPDGRWQSQGEVVPRRPVAGAWHVYGLRWSPDALVFTLDGAEYHRVERARLGPQAEWPFDGPQVLLLNLAVGGTWPGDPDDTTPDSATMLVDHVRVHEGG